jgi:hypothetical protein
VCSTRPYGQVYRAGASRRLLVPWWRDGYRRPISHWGASREGVAGASSSFVVLVASLIIVAPMVDVLLLFLERQGAALEDLKQARRSR